MLELKDVSRHFGGLHALTNVNMQIPQGKVVGLIGPNGAGKTTLINNISGLDHPTSGKITFAGHDISRMSREVELVLKERPIDSGQLRESLTGLALAFANPREAGDLPAPENPL